MKYALALLMFTGLRVGCYAQNDCAAALVKATYNSFSSDHVDQRLASFVTEGEYNEVKHDAGANATIFGIPIGANYDDFQRNAHQRATSYSTSLTHDQAQNIMWTGLDPHATSAYSECLKANVFSQRGLHVAVRAATANDVSIIVSWLPQGNDPKEAFPRWQFASAGKAK